MSARELDDDFIRLGELVCTLLQTLEHSEHLDPPTQALDAVLNLVQNVATFLQDSFKHNGDGKLRPYSLFAVSSPSHRRSRRSRFEKSSYRGLL